MSLPPKSPSLKTRNPDALRPAGYLGWLACLCAALACSSETNGTDSSPVSDVTAEPSIGPGDSTGTSMSQSSSSTTSPAQPSPANPTTLPTGPSSTSTATGSDTVPSPSNANVNPAPTPPGTSGAGGGASEAGSGGTPTVMPEQSSGGTGGSSVTPGTGGVGGNTNGNAGGGSNGSPTFHVFLLLGQSNMAGYPKAQEADRAEDPRVQVLGFDDCADTGRKTDEWDIAAPPLHECWNGAIGPGDYFAKALLDVIPEGDTIGLVPCAISGEKIETFMKAGGTKYDWIMQRARLAQDAGGKIEGMLFHQGESNTADSSWPGKVATFVTDLRADLELGEVPFLAGELAYSGNSSSHNPLVNQLPSVLSNAHVVSAEGLAIDSADTQWNVHFDHDAQVSFGKRYAEKMIEALGW